MKSLSDENQSACNFERWDDDQLAEIAKGGNREARNALYFRHRALLGRLARRAHGFLRVAGWVNRDRVIAVEPEDIEQG